MANQKQCTLETETLITKLLFRYVGGSKENRAIW